MPPLQIRTRRSRDDVLSENEEEEAALQSPTSYLMGNILRAAEVAVSAPILNLAPDFGKETYSIVSRQRSVRSVRSFKSVTRARRTSVVPIEDQRHPGKPGVKISRTTRNIDEVLAWEDEKAAAKERELQQESQESDDTYEDEDVEYPGPIPLAVLLVSICLVVFLVSLDRTIITTAIPFISRQFNSYSDIGWYGSAYLLTASAFQPLYGRIFTLFNVKWSFLAATLLFEIGSAICGVAPNSMTLIIGRAISGVGSAGILTGAFVVVANAVPLAQRPLFASLVGLMYGVGATVGPLLGGVFTDEVSWRWCFYVNLPIGGFSIIAMILFFKPKNTALTNVSFFERVIRLDIVGNVILLGAFVMLFLALQYSEQRFAWNSPREIGLLSGSAATFVLFIVWLWWKGEDALVPLRIVKQRSVAAACFMAFFIFSALILHVYYLPFWFQAIKGTSAMASGVDMIPYLIANAIFSVVAGVFVSKTGYFTPPAIVGMAIGTAGCGLLTLLHVNTDTGHWIGYQIVASLGLGMAVQQTYTAVQTVLADQDIPIGTAAVVSMQSLGGAIFVTVGNTILQNELFHAGNSGQLPGVNVQLVVDVGAGGIRSVVPPQMLGPLLVAYNSALRKVFISAIPLAGLAFISSLFLEWKNVLKVRVDERKS